MKKPGLAGQPVQVTGMNEKNGLGRLISRIESKSLRKLLKAASASHSSACESEETRERKQHLASPVGRRRGQCEHLLKSVCSWYNGKPSCKDRFNCFFMPSFNSAVNVSLSKRRKYLKRIWNSERFNRTRRRNEVSGQYYWCSRYGARVPPLTVLQVWLAADTSKLRKASDMCEVLLATLLGDVVKSAISGEYPFRLPRVVQDMPVDDLCDLMERFNVILGFQKDDSENGELHRIHRLRLVIFGIKSTSAVMRLLEHIEELHPGCLGSLNPDSLELCDSHFGVSITKALVTMEKDWLQRLARLMQAGRQQKNHCFLNVLFFVKVELILPNCRFHTKSISGRLIPFPFFFLSQAIFVPRNPLCKSRFRAG